jgi:hemerythrin-like domain-containing protein
MKAGELAKWMREEHQILLGLMNSLQDQVSCVPRANQGRWIEAVLASFGHMRAHTVKQMAMEERDGYMVPVKERRPALATEIERLAHEHKELQRLMEGIYVFLQDLLPGDRLLIRDCCHRINDFISYMEHHTNAENLLVLSVFTDDIGAEG